MSKHELFCVVCSILLGAAAGATPATSPGTCAGGDAVLALDRELALGAESGAARAPGPRDDAPVQSSWATDVFVLVGQREMDDSTAWDMIDEPIALGVELSMRKRGSILGFEGGLLVAADSATVLTVDVEDTFLELYLGGRITADLGGDRIHPYVGAGGSLVYAEVSGESGGVTITDDDSSVGLYGHAGVYVTLGRAFLLGLDARVLTGTDVNLFGISTDADYTQLALLLGWSV